ncbi:hypothetical protein KY290_037541 [Solanum tuberosum]|uniref:Cystatin domain-containing protein n=1 Tax=Solanum tuberosum TaxID=4113 RepID=A0ABQ7TVT5_SOLTU|nr:hypothetical protein KY284_036892 [Solanum tuberosum]KAH0738836.1 hypothetical protein KY290_037541 [Solanum tuberosum]
MSMPCDCGRSEKVSPPEKKLKLEAEGDGSDLKVEDGDQNGNEESSGYDSDDWTTWPNKDAFIKYFQQVNESDGFDFDEYPGSSMYTPIRPLLKFEGLPKFAAEIKGYASMAIKHYFGDDGKERNVTKIVKINAGGPRDVTYYITFRIDNEGKEETFQAKVELPIGGTIEFPICRRKD